MASRDREQDVRPVALLGQIRREGRGQREALLVQGHDAVMGDDDADLEWSQAVDGLDALSART
jgi:hypothetical protein